MIINTGFTNNNGNADTLDGLHANEIASNPNLLDNPNFKINQRGQSEYTTTDKSIYTVDRWMISPGSKFDVVNSVFSWGEDYDTGDGYIQQNIENPTDLQGKVVTLSAEFETNTDDVTVAIYSHDGSDYTVVKGLSSRNGVISVTTTIPKNSQIIFVRIIGDISTGTFVPKWAKLELGSVATPFIPPDPATELVKCQRYFERVYIPMDKFLIGVMWSCLNSCSYVILYSPKRIVPTVTPYSFGRFVDILNHVTYDMETFTIDSITNEYAEIISTWTIESSNKVIGVVDNLGYVDVSADL